MSAVEVAERIRIHSASLTAAERRVAEAILRSPQSVGFGTVADLADSAKVGAASVVRLATKLGFDGYSDLQASIQHDLMRQLRPAVERIDETAGDGAASAHAAVELANVRATIDAADSRSIEQLAARLADLSRPVRGAVRRGVGGSRRRSSPISSSSCATDVDVLQRLRRRGAPRRSPCCPPTPRLIVIDLRRYERWVLDAHASLRERGIWSAAFTDSMLSPLAARAEVTFVLSADSVGAVRQPRRHAGAAQSDRRRGRRRAAELGTRPAGGGRGGVEPARAPLTRSRTVRDPSLAWEQMSEVRRRSRASSHVRDHQPSRRRQDDADREVPALRRDARARRARSRRAPGGGRRPPTGWRWSRSAASRSRSTALSFEYRGHQLNLLDTPGHRDFSEDTYRVLSAVDAVVMVLDSAKGIEPQTLKLFEVCRARDAAGDHVPQQVRPPGPRAARAARRDRAADRAARRRRSPGRSVRRASSAA